MRHLGASVPATGALVIVGACSAMIDPRDIGGRTVVHPSRPPRRRRARPLAPGDGERAIDRAESWRDDPPDPDERADHAADAYERWIEP